MIALIILIMLMILMLEIEISNEELQHELNKTARTAMFLELSERQYWRRRIATGGQPVPLFILERYTTCTPCLNYSP